MNFKSGLAAASIGLFAVAPAMAQTKVVQVTPAPAPDSKQVIPEKQGNSIQTGRSESLSRKLSNSGGVITPNDNVDPGMKVPAPGGQHTMPVIPPAATGGDTAK